MGRSKKRPGRKATARMRKADPGGQGNRRARAGRSKKLRKLRVLLGWEEGE